MHGDIPPFPQYAFMAWCSVKAQQPKGKRPFERPRRKREDNIIMDFKEITWKVWTGFICLRVWTSGGL
jgi:hypothetical protein